MRILYFGNNWLGWQIAKWLREQNENIAGLFLHPIAKRKFGNELISDAGVESYHIYEDFKLNSAEMIQTIKRLKPDIGLSILFDYIFKSEIIELFPRGIINLHSAYLPYNRGQYPNVWSIVDGTPAGVTLHYIDAGLDTGDIIAQSAITVEPVDTGSSLYHKLETAGLKLFKHTWPKISSGQIQPIKMDVDAGTYHKTRDVDNIDAIDLEATYNARDLINIIRARTFHPYPGAYYVHDGQKIYLRLELIAEEDLLD